MYLGWKTTLNIPFGLRSSTVNAMVDSWEFMLAVGLCPICFKHIYLWSNYFQYLHTWNLFHNNLTPEFFLFLKELYKKARGILNKLTPQKFQTLVKQMAQLEITSEEHLKGVANLVFEKVRWLKNKLDEHVANKSAW